MASDTETIRLPNATVFVEARAAYIYMREEGQLKDLAEAQLYFDAMDMLVTRRGIRAALIDSRAETSVQSGAVREAMWQWLGSGKTFEALAYVLVDSMTVTRVNMRAVSLGIRVRAFPDINEAVRWLLRRSTMPPRG